jgi:hypothetical protein
LYDLQYTNVNSFGVTGDYLRVFLIDREEVDEQKKQVLDEEGNPIKRITLANLSQIIIVRSNLLTQLILGHRLLILSQVQ